MKGVVFTEFMEMVEDQFSLEIADRILEASDLPSGGIYTAIGTYDHSEMIELVTHLSEEVGIPVPQLVHGFGEYLFRQFVQGYSEFFEDIDSTFTLMENIEDYIHVEVRKLYPDAELPTFDCERSETNRLVLTYRSSRPFADLAHGLIKGSIAHFGEVIEVEREDLNEHNTSVRFSLTKNG